MFKEKQIRKATQNRHDSSTIKIKMKSMVALNIATKIFQNLRVKIIANDDILLRN